MKTRGFSAASLLVLSCACLPTAARSQWSGPVYAYDGPYPQYIVVNTHTGDAGTVYGLPPGGGMVKAEVGVAYQNGTADVGIKFRATYTSTPGTPDKVVYAVSGRTISITGTGGSGTATFSADFPSGYRSDSAPPTVQGSVGVGSEHLSGTSVVLHFIMEAYATVTQSGGSHMSGVAVGTGSYSDTAP